MAVNHESNFNTTRMSLAQHLSLGKTIMNEPARRLPIGAELLDGGVDFRVWAPAATSVEVLLDTEQGVRCVGKLDAEEEGGYFAARIADVDVGSRYWFRLDGEEPLCPDPASRFQPDGPHGPSQVVDPSRFAWTDGAWPGVRLEGQVIYEMHIGTFTGPGTWAAADRRASRAGPLGVTVLEVMPIADFPGRFGWGYDGVCFFAPTRLYGEPDDFRRFVDRAHALGLAVILDVVYNHAGPDGNCLERFSPHYFTDRYETDWGTALNFDGPHCGPVREFYREQRRLLDRRVSPRRPAARCHPVHLRSFAAAHPRRP